MDSIIPGDVSLEYASHDGQHEQRERVGDGGRADGYRDAALVGQAVAQHCGVGYERVRGVHAGQEHGGDEAVAERRPVQDEAHGHGDYERQYAVGEGAHAVFAEVAHVHFQAGEEHDVV